MEDEKLISLISHLLRHAKYASADDNARVIINHVREHDKPEGCETFWVYMLEEPHGISGHRRLSPLFPDKADADRSAALSKSAPDVFSIPVPKQPSERERTMKTLREKSPDLLDLDLRAAVESAVRMLEGEK